ncbi:AAA family ATPase [Spirillospora sp. NPDC048911]|uniref:AAA family ATPase n=1 Tax=Spirillospora sp. NPDC048911 TaxID=3364527 RepID=UPI0037103FBA
MVGTPLTGRSRELRAIGRLLAGASDGAGGALVLRGEPGIGKTALLSHAERAATGMRVLRVIGVETEVELPFAALHQLLLPVLDRLTDLPAPQAAALRGAFGMAEATTRDRFMIGLATFTVLADLAAEAPVLCLIDNLEWLDQPSADALLIAARKSRDDAVALLLSAREVPRSFTDAGIPELALSRLKAADAADLLHEHAPLLAPDIRERILQDASGNPLAIAELAKASRDEDLPRHPAETPPLTDRLIETFHHHARALPDTTQTLLLVLAADDTGDVALAVRAARQLGVQADAADDVKPAEAAGLLVLKNGRAEFCHPLIRSALYQSAAHGRRLEVHQAIAEALAQSGDATERRTWHLAAAATGPREDIALAMERVAEKARSRAGHAAAVSAYIRAAELTPAATARARRYTLAAEAAIEAGQLRHAEVLADLASTLTIDEKDLASLARIRSTIEFEQGSPATAGRILTEGAKLIETSDPGTAALMLAAAIRNASFASDPGLARDAADDLNRLPLPRDPMFCALTSLADILSGDYSAATGLNERLQALPTEHPQERLLAASLALVAADDERAHGLASSVVAQARERGTIGLLPSALAIQAQADLLRDRHPDAMAAATEGHRVSQDLGQPHRTAHLGALVAWLSAVQGDEERCRGLSAQAIAYGNDHGVATTPALATWALGILDLTLGRYDDAVEHLRNLQAGATSHPVIAMYGLVDLIEASYRSGTPAVQALPALLTWTKVIARPWADAIAARCRALTRPAEAETHFTTALRHHRPTDQPFQQARTQLLYGEYLLNHNRPTEATPHLQAAQATFKRLNAHPWTTRAVR